MLPPTTEYRSLSPDRAIAYFRRKLALPIERWSQVYAEQHERAFVVAGAMRRDMVEDFQSAIARAIEEGTTITDFRKEFDSIVQRYGWDYNGSRGWRTRVIYETNLTGAYAAGELEAQRELQRELPYWRYRHGGSLNPREQHLAWDGMVLRSDDPFWQTHYPPNGWGCSCYVEALDADGLQRLGKSGPDPSPEIETYEWTNPATGEVKRVPQGISPGFEYAPGDQFARSHAPGYDVEAAALATIPEGKVWGGGSRRLFWPRETALLGDLPDDELQRLFLERFDAGPDRPAVFEAAGGARHLISDWMFRQGGGMAAVRAAGLERYVGALAEALADPDEVWTRIERNARGRHVTRTTYLIRVRTDAGTELVGIDLGSVGWRGAAGSESDMEAWRRGVRIYRRQ